MYLAMFDEIDEGTAMYKLAETQADCLVVDPLLVPLDEDGYSLPSDWYLQIGTEIQKMMDGRIALTEQLPIVPFEVELIPFPEDGARGVSNIPILAWSSNISVDAFEIYLKKNSLDFTGSDLISSQTDTTLILTSPLENKATYYWRVDVLKDSFRSTGSVWSFTVETTGTDRGNKGTIYIYPNPVSNEFYFSGMYGRTDYKVYDILGNQIFEGNVNNNEIIQIGHLPAGMYIVSAGEKQIKLIKN